MTIDQEKLGELLGRFVGDLGATIAAGNVVVGHRLGLYRGLAEGPATAEELARRTGTDPPYVAEWLRGQAAGGYVGCDPAAGRFSLTEEQAFALADPDGTLYLPGAFLLALGALRAESQVTDAFRSGAGMGWHEHHEDVFAGTEMFFRPGYVANLTSSWIPAFARGAGGRRRLRPRGADRAAGPGLSHVRDRGLGLPPGVRRHRAQARRRGRPGGPGPVRGRVGADLLRDRIRPRRHVRLPARHGRSG